ncbi:MAG: type 1 glutamine amidotransferase [Deltaproteobacteria bacterium]|nr:type 1 glutamine amidotransferase [Deltaproteobacteria bacterium]
MSDSAVLILDLSLHPEAYRPEGHWSRHLGRPWVAARPPRGTWPDPALRPSHVILTGCEGSILGDDPWILRLCEHVRDFATRGTPMLGSCFGHQLLVRALAGRQHVQATPTPEFGWVRATLTPEGRGDPVTGALPPAFDVFTCHFDEVHPLPAGWVRLGSTRDCANALIRHGTLPVWGVQPHPEIDPAEGQGLLDALPALLPERTEVVRRHHHPACRDSFVTPALVSAFLRAVP